MGNTQARLEDPDPPKREETTEVSPEVIQVWNEVAKHVKNGTEVPLDITKSALKYVKEYLSTHEQAQQFVEQYMDGLAKNILSRESPKEESDESQLIEECLNLSTVIIVENMDLQLKEHGNLETTSTILTNLFCKDSKYYQENEGKRIRYKMIDVFHVQGGFSSLVKYISSRQFATSSHVIEFLECVARTTYELADAQKMYSTPEQVATDILALAILSKLPRSSSDFEASPSSSKSSPAAESTSVESVVLMPDFSASQDERVKDAICVANAVVGFVGKISLEQLPAESFQAFEFILLSVEIVLKQSTDEDIQDCAKVIRGLVLQMLTSNRVELKDFGWDRIPTMVSVAKRCRRPPQYVIVSNAARGFVNGTFSFLKQASHIRTTVFEKRVVEGVGRDVYLYSVERKRCDDYLWVIVSSRHESVDQHYIAVSSSYAHPPADGWRHMSPDDKRSVPTLRSIGFATSTGQETNTLEHQLVKWAHDNRIISLFCNESRNSNFREWAVCMSSLINLMSFMNKRCDKENHSTKHLLSPSHLLPVWDLATESDEDDDHDDDDDESSNLITLLALVFPHLPDDIGLTLLRKMSDSLQSRWSQSFVFFNELVYYWDAGNGHEMPFMSDILRTETKKIMWSLKTFFGRVYANDDAKFGMLEMTQVPHRDWFEWECTNLHDPGSTKDVAIPPKAAVSVLDTKRRLVEASLPVESPSGEYYVGMFLRASCDTYENGEIMLLSYINQSDIEECLKEDEDRVNVQAWLPDDGVWSIEWCGALFRKEVVLTPRSDLTTVDLTTRDKELMKRRREEVDATDELAKQHAGDIQSTVRKLRGSSSSKMKIESRFSLLNNAMVGGRSTLNKLRRLVATYVCDEAYVSGIISLEHALAEAQLPMTELEALLKSRNKKERIKGFKAHVTALLESGDTVSWLESVQPDDLDSLGGDSNRLYQLLVEAKGSQHNAAAIESASTRADLFSKKQIKTLLTLWKEVRRTFHARKENETPSESITTDLVPLENHNAKQSPNASAPAPAPAPASITQHSCSKEPLAKRTFCSSTESSLLAFLKENAGFLISSPQAFHHWLIDSKDIACLNDLADAVADDQYLQNVLQQVGVKGIKRSFFKEAVLVAIDRDYNDECEQNKENEHPLSIFR